MNAGSQEACTDFLSLQGLKKAVNCVFRNRRFSPCQKQRFTAHRHRTPGNVFHEVLPGAQAERNHTLFISLAVYDDITLREMDIGQIKPNHLSTAQA